MSIFTVIEQAKRRDDVVPAYADEILADLNEDSEVEDFGEVNQAIIDKWSLAGLRYIKERAWKRVYSFGPSDLGPEVSDADS